MDAIADLYADQAVWMWIGLAAALLIAEIVTGSGWLLWASPSAGVTAVATAVLGLSFPQALLLFAVLTIASTLLARRYLPRTEAEGGDINDNVSRLVGHRGAAVQPFAAAAGRVFIDGKEWAARLTEGEDLEAGAAVEVTGVEGARLLVRRA